MSVILSIYLNRIITAFRGENKASIVICLTYPVDIPCTETEKMGLLNNSSIQIENAIHSIIRFNDLEMISKLQPSHSNIFFAIHIEKYCKAT